MRFTGTGRILTWTSAPAPGLAYTRKEADQGAGKEAPGPESEELAEPGDLVSKILDFLHNLRIRRFFVKLCVP
jgi:hypothetical protein